MRPSRVNLPTGTVCAARPTTHQVLLLGCCRVGITAGGTSKSCQLVSACQSAKHHSIGPHLRFHMADCHSTECRCSAVAKHDSMCLTPSKALQRRRGGDDFLWAMAQ